MEDDPENLDKNIHLIYDFFQKGLSSELFDQDLKKLTAYKEGDKYDQYYLSLLQKVMILMKTISENLDISLRDDPMYKKVEISNKKKSINLLRDRLTKIESFMPMELEDIKASNAEQIILKKINDAISEKYKKYIKNTNAIQCLKYFSEYLTKMFK